MKLQKWAEELRSVWLKNIHGIKFADSMKMCLKIGRTDYENIGNT